MVQDAIIVGAGVAGLRCAGELRRTGRSAVVLERARSVGGRCATRRFQGQPVDFGPVFLHGQQPEFLEALRHAGGTGLIRDWPQRVEGNGSPCQPESLHLPVQRLAMRSGLRSFPQQLAEGLDIRLETEVAAIRVRPYGFELVDRTGTVWRCRDLVLALALEQSRNLLETLPDSLEIRGIQALLGLFSSLPCCTLILGYPLETPAPPWDILYPGESGMLQLVAHDSAKREAPRFLTLVAQARPKWSRLALTSDVEPEAWPEAILDELAHLLGPWAARPLWQYPHRWRHARADAVSELAQPVQVAFPEGQRLGLAGEIFSPGGGVQAAWSSGTRMAARLLAKERG